MFSLKLPVLDSGHASKHRTDCPVLSPRDVSQVTDFSVDLCLKCCRAHSLPRCPARPNSRPLAQGHRPAIVWLLRYGSNQEDSSNANENLYCARDACSHELMLMFMLDVPCIHHVIRSGAGRIEPPCGSTRRLCDHSVRLLSSILCLAASARRDSAGRRTCPPTCRWNSGEHSGLRVSALRCQRSDCSRGRRKGRVPDNQRLG